MFNVKFSLGFSSEVFDTVWWQSNGQSNGSKVAIQWVAIQWSSRVVAIQWEKGARKVAREVAREVAVKFFPRRIPKQKLHSNFTRNFTSNFTINFASNFT